MSGELLRGKYRLLERLGQGGMAVVHAGVHVGTDRSVAIKRLLPDRVSDPKLVARFELEARAAGRIRSKYVLEILDIDRDEQGVPFLVMERLHGESLSAKLRREGRLQVEEALGILRQVLLGLAEAHGAGVIHRDLKPANIFLERDPDGATLAKLVDFGISKVRGVDPHNELTEEGETLGTMAYMPPEQLGGGGNNITPAADIWSVGVMLFRLLTGEMPFSGSDTMSLILAILQDPTPRLADRGIEPAVSRALQPTIDRALAKDPADRFWGADQMLQALGDAGQSLGFAAAIEPHSPAFVSQVHRRPLGPRATQGLGPQLALALAVGSIVGWAGVSAALTPPVDPFLRVETSPVDASLRVDDRPAPERGRVPIAPGQLRTARVEAPGHRPASLALPDRPGALVLVALAASSAPPPAASIAPLAAASSAPLAATAAPSAPRGSAPAGKPPAGAKTAVRTAADPPRPPTLLTSPD